jgi:hypothetical protein
MKLTDLNPRWVGAGGDGIRDRNGSPVPYQHGIGLLCDCPCGKCNVPLYVQFKQPLDGGPPPDKSGAPLWDRTGETFENLTLRPSILRKDGCGWHGFITNGEVTSC